MCNAALHRYAGAATVALGMAFLMTTVPVETGQASVFGYVVDSGTGAPVGGATLSVSRSGSAERTAVASAVSRDDGGFELPAINVDGVLTVAAPGYATKRVRWPLANTEINLERGAELTVHIKNQAGAFVPAIVAVATRHPGNFIESAFPAPAGIVEIRDAASGPTTIVARSKDLAPALVSLQVNPGQRHGPVEIVLPPAGTLQGVVVDTLGLPLPDAVIVAAYGPELPMGRTLANFLVGRLRSADDGRFQISNIVPNVSLRVHAEYQGRSSPVITTTLKPGETRHEIVRFQ